MKARALYMEGGGDNNRALASALRQSTTKLLERAGVTQKPRLHACGGRAAAYEAFVQSRPADGDPFLLVDSEEPVAAGSLDPWQHVKHRPGGQWQRPHGARDDQLHFLAVSMETWLVTDPAGIKQNKQRFREDALPSATAFPDLERLEKARVQNALDRARRDTTTPKYNHNMGFDLLKYVDPRRIEERCLTWGKRFFLTAKSWT